MWFYDMKADGFSLDDKRVVVSENDITDIIKRFKNREQEIDRKRTEQSFMVPKQEIADNGYDLSINKYKQVEYEKLSILQHQRFWLTLRLWIKKSLKRWKN